MEVGDTGTKVGTDLHVDTILALRRNMLPRLRIGLHLNQKRGVSRRVQMRRRSRRRRDARRQKSGEGAQCGLTDIMSGIVGLRSC